MAENLWSLREQKKLSVAALANRAGLPIGLIIEYESGQRSIDPRHLNRLARALYVEESDIRLQSDRRPAAQVQPPREPMREQPPAARPPRPKDRMPRAKPPPRPPAPAKPSQITYLEGLLRRLDRSTAALETEIGGPLAQLDRPTASELIKRLQAEIADSSPADRHRAYLPEAVDQFEEKYLSAAHAAGDVQAFTLYDGTSVRGQVVGFGAYNITVRQADGLELTLNKLALVCYRKEPSQ
jgi:transcriptional regulator with XRE-family HTH domain